MYTGASFSDVSGTVPGHDDAERAVGPSQNRDRDLKAPRWQANINK